MTSSSLIEQDNITHDSIVKSIEALKNQILTLHLQAQGHLQLIAHLEKRNDSLGRALKCWQSADKYSKEFGSRFSDEAASSYEAACAVRDAVLNGKSS